VNKHLIRSAVVLSAGIGERLRPLTNHVPKALFPVGDRPAIIRIIDKLRSMAISDFHVNTFHLAAEIEECLNQLSGINMTVKRESVLRGTGGGIANFREQLKESDFLLHNCDVYSDDDFMKLIRHHYNRNALITMMVVNYPPINTLIVENGEITGFSTEDGLYTYSGIAVISSRIWYYLPDEQTFSLIPVLKTAVVNGETISAYVSSEYWVDFGTPEQYWELHRHLAGGGNGYVSELALLDNATLNGFNFIGAEARLKNAVIENCIVFPGAEVIDENLKNTIINGDCRVSV